MIVMNLDGSGEATKKDKIMRYWNEDTREWLGSSLEELEIVEEACRNVDRGERVSTGGTATIGFPRSGRLPDVDRR